jgi:hypothetical protein
MSFFTGRKFRRNYVASASRTLRSACAPTVEAMERRTLLSATLEVGTGHPFSTIQAALDAAAPGDTVLVSPGTYTENVTIEKPLTLLSTGGRDDTTIQGISGAGASATLLITPGVNNVVIGDANQGFTINGIDNGNPAVENAAVYLRGSHTDVRIEGNEIVAAGDEGLLAESAAVISQIVIDGNVFSGQAFVGTTPAGSGFAQQFTLPNVPRQLVVIGNGGGNLATANATDISFTNNLITGTAGGINGSGQQQGNTLVTIDAASSTIQGNTFAGTTTAFGSALRVRRPGTDISDNAFVSTGMSAGTTHLFVQNNTTPLAAIVAANSFDGGSFVATGSDVSVSVQGGVGRALPGQTLNVLPGAYTENVTINKNLALLSTGGRDVTTINGIPNGALGTILVTNNTTAVTIGAPGQGFTINGIDNPSPGIESAAVYFQGSHSGAQVRDNLIVANGDGGLSTEFGATITTFLIDGNTFAGKTFAGTTPAGTGFAQQFTLPNVPRQLVVIGNGQGNAASALATDITFTNNLITGTAGGTNVHGEQGNTLVTIDAANSTIQGNTFAGTTTRFASALRVRRPDTDILDNAFSGADMTATTTLLTLYAAGSAVTGNTFADGGVGVEVLDPTGTSALHYNDITGNATAGLVNSTPTLLDATFNYWDSYTGPTAAANPAGTGDAVFGNVDYTPWLVAPAATPTTTIISGGGSTLIFETASGNYAFFAPDGSVFAGTGARVQDGVLHIHDQSTGGKVDVNSSLSGPVTIHIRGKAKATYTI